VSEIISKYRNITGQYSEMFSILNDGSFQLVDPHLVRETMRLSRTSVFKCSLMYAKNRVWSLICVHRNTWAIGPCLKS